MPSIVQRQYSQLSFDALRAAGHSPLFARLYAARGIARPQQLDHALAGLLSPSLLKNAKEMARHLADAIAARKKILIVADYDADGATACAVAIRALRKFGATVDYLVPNRFEYGYGLTPEIVALAAAKSPDLLLTVDNGIASVEGVAAANASGIAVLITDHHLPGNALPDALCIVNPNQPGCEFPSKHLAGVGVIFYVMLALRAELRRRGMFCAGNPPSPPFFKGGHIGAPVDDHYHAGAAASFENGMQSSFEKGGDAQWRGDLDGGNAAANFGEAQQSIPPSPLFEKGPTRSGEGIYPMRSEPAPRSLLNDSPRKEPNLASLLDLVALGTVADVVKLDDNNRILVHHGLARIRAGRACPGIAALLRIARREARKAGCYELGFMLGPRLNAAGRLADMGIGIECLLSDSEGSASALAQQLDGLNHERRDIEAGMQETALVAVDDAQIRDSFTISLFDPGWHQGVVGIVAARIKDKLHRPTIAFARGNNGELKGSGRAIAGLHLRDALDLVAKRHPGLLLKFGGHAAAAGLTLRESDFERFSRTFEQVARGLLTAADLERVIETDGSLDDQDIYMESARALAGHIWGQGFPQPVFHDRFSVESQRVVADKHLKMKLRKLHRSTAHAAAAGTAGATTVHAPATDSIEAMLFRSNAPLPCTIDAVYRLDIYEYNGASCLQLIVEHWQDASKVVCAEAVLNAVD
ncbi:MAG: single-stranded-DNA-specific exonuclease RecJ [Burkholderiales bacterium]|nr:single-stranded-DNA-specific exonuclease RecJ [Burkholderiales bacterium]